MSTIYVVTEGCYSDYGIMGVYSTKENAERAREIHSGNGRTAEIEGYNLDDFFGVPNARFPWYVHMRRDGEVVECARTYAKDSGGHPWMPYCEGPSNGGSVLFYVNAKDEKHAIKIANERRAGLVASGQWTGSHREWRDRGCK